MITSLETDQAYRDRLVDHAARSGMSQNDRDLLITTAGLGLDDIGKRAGLTRMRSTIAEPGDKPPIKRPDEALVALGELFRSRNAVYGSTYKDFGKVMCGFFHGPVTLSTPEEWNRMMLFFHLADKLARYSRKFSDGGHGDSLDDISVYAQLLRECDEEEKLKGEKK